MTDTSKSIGIYLSLQQALNHHIHLVAEKIFYAHTKKNNCYLTYIDQKSKIIIKQQVQTKVALVSIPGTLQNIQRYRIPRSK